MAYEEEEITIDPNPANDFEVDMQTIRDYVSAVVETKSKIATAYLSAIDNFQTTVQFASPQEATPDILGAVLKSGLKAAEKAAVSAASEATGASLGPLVEMVHGIYDEIERASKAAQGLAVAQLIKDIRAAVTNAYTQDQTGEALRKQIEDEYNNNDAGGRGGYIAGIQIELAALGSAQAPKEEVLEATMYLAWINQNFNNDCIEGTGIASIQFDDEGNLTSATVQAPQGDKVAAALNKVMNGAGIYSLMDWDVVKKICRGYDCMCFEGNNVIRKPATADDTQSFLTAPETWQKLTQFG
jgi:hypothetical protein